MAEGSLVFLLDVDNTLLDSDRVTADLRAFLAQRLGEAEQKHYWTILESLHTELGYADYLGAVQRFRSERPQELGILSVAAFLLDYPYTERLYPKALEVVACCRRWGVATVFSDGNAVLQPRKVESSGISEAVKGRVLIYIHKEQALDDVRQRYPAGHYVMVDDQVRLLTAVKQAWGPRVTTVFVRQGRYARDPRPPGHPEADVTVNRIEELLGDELQPLLRPARSPNAST